MDNKIIEANEKFPQTHIWMDSFHVEHHKYGLENHNKGVTTSPTWVSKMLLDEPLEEHKGEIEALVKQHPTMNEQEIMWQFTLEMARKRSVLLLPLFKSGGAKMGRFSVQTSIYDYNNSEKMLKMAREVHSLGDNMQVKIPSTKAGIVAMEEATYEGISIMATLCFSVDQAVCAAEAVERGLARRRKEGLDTSGINPVCAVLLGMQEDWLKAYGDCHSIAPDPVALSYSAVAVFKKIYKIYKERNYSTRLLTAYYRHRLHFSEFIGGDLIMTIPEKWQRRFEKSTIKVGENIKKEVPQEILDELSTLPPFLLAYNEGSLSPEEFTSFGPVILTLRYFTSSYDKAVLKVRDIMLPDPTK